MFCLLSGRFDALLPSQNQSILIGHDREQCRALPPRPDLACCLQPLQNQVQCLAPALCRPDIELCMCSLVADSCLFLLLNKQSIPGRCKVQSKDFCRQLILLAALLTQPPCTSSLLSQPLLPQFLSISWPAHFQEYRGRI